jgi:hypothetical protein
MVWVKCSIAVCRRAEQSYLPQSFAEENFGRELIFLCSLHKLCEKLCAALRFMNAYAGDQIIFAHTQ